MNGLEQHLPILQVIVPLLTAPLLLLLEQRRLAWLAACAASLCAFGIAVLMATDVHGDATFEYALGSWAAPYGISLVVDAFTALLLLIVTGASSVALLISGPGFDANITAERQPLFLAAWLLALAGLSGIVVAGDAFNIFVFMEISSLATYVLIAGGAQRQALTAVFRYLLMGTIGATFYLVGIGLVYMMTGTLNLADMSERVASAPADTPLLAAAGFIAVGLAIKAAVFPLHGWLPNAYVHAPHAVTVFIGACSTKVALYVLLRFQFTVFHVNFESFERVFAMLFMPLAVAAILVASVLAVFERNLKKMLAYSSVAQVGYIVLGAALLSVAGLSAGIVHMFNHALAKGALFIAVACLALRMPSLAIADLAGMARRMPLTMAGFVAAGLSLIGIPGTAGFVGKWQLVLAALEQGTLGALLVVPVLLGSLLAVIYVWRVVEGAYFSAGRVEDGRTVRQEAPAPMLILLWLAVAANIWFGLNPELPLGLAHDAAQSLGGS